MQKYARYQELAAHFPKIIFGGRLGQYSYFDMDDTIASAFKITTASLPLQS